MQFDLDHSREILTRTPILLRSWLTGLSDPWLRGNYGDGTFSPYDVLGHLIHGERADWIPRARMILEHGEARAFEPFDRYAQFEESGGKPLAALLDEFEEARGTSLRRLDALNITPALLARRGRHPALGAVTLAELLATWVAHDLNHVAQISRCMAAQYADAVGPWRAYLGILNQSTTRMDAEGLRRQAEARDAARPMPEAGVRFAQPVNYAARPIRFRGIREFGAWRLKEYAITLENTPLHETDFEAGVRAALDCLPSAAVAAARPGVGMLLLHAGRGALYVVLAWWDNENELPLRVFVRADGERTWRPAGSHESVCVWDLEVIGFERQAYTETVLAADSDIAEYLRRRLGA